MPDSRTATPVRTRSRGFYRVTLALALVALVVMLASGHFQSVFGMLTHRGGVPPAITPERFGSMFLMNLAWLAGIAPLCFAAWELGSQRTAARRGGFPMLAGFRDVFRIALGEGLSAADVASFDRPPRDRPGLALAMAAGAAVLMPAFFLTFVPPLRTPAGLAWVGGAGLLMGVIVYCHRRAIAYIDQEPGRWDMFRQYRLLNPARYQPAGRRFVRIQILASVVLPVWWLLGGMFAMGMMR